MSITITIGQQDTQYFFKQIKSFTVRKGLC